MSREPSKRHLVTTPELLTIQWCDGTASEFASVWLRDNAPQNRDPYSGQRLIDVADLPARPQIRAATLEADAIIIQWADESAPASFDPEWLFAHGTDTAQSTGDAAHGATPWLGATHWLDGALRRVGQDFAWTTRAQLEQDPPARLAWLTRLLQTGMAFVSAVPPNEAGILDAMTWVGQVCETNYGRVFDVRAVPQPENLAYSDLGLGLHTDNPYREPVPGFQALHVLVAPPTGGDSLFADGFALCDHLRSVDRHAFETLASTPVAFSYRSPDAELHAERPMIQVSCRGAVTAVHYNSRSITPLREHGRAGVRFYAAYRRFAALLRDPAHQLRYRLREGELVVFDNHRILHGRTPFSCAAHARHLRGCYLTRDSVYSGAAVLRRRLSRRESR